MDESASHRHLQLSTTHDSLLPVALNLPQHKIVELTRRALRRTLRDARIRLLSENVGREPAHCRGDVHQNNNVQQNLAEIDLNPTNDLVADINDRHANLQRSLHNR